MVHVHQTRNDKLSTAIDDLGAGWNRRGAGAVYGRDAAADDKDGHIAHRRRIRIDDRNVL
jgi:hypothetical protein